MNNSAQQAQHVQDSVQKLQKGIKDKIFDILAFVILAVLIALSLGIIERRLITLEELGDIFVECIPFFFAAMLLNNTYYTKGVFVGKSTKSFILASNEYSVKIGCLSGREIDSLDEFCEHFNAEALSKKQVMYLNRASISFNKFNECTEENDEPVKVWSNRQIKRVYGKERAKWIIAAKKVKVKGLRVNGLMGTNDSADITDIGSTESQLARKRTGTSAVQYALSVLIMSLMAVKNVADWGWFGIALVVFKCVYIFARSYTSFFDGYNDVTIHLVHHINRKTDILKQFDYWYSSNYGNKLENS